MKPVCKLTCTRQASQSERHQFKTFAKCERDIISSKDTEIKQEGHDGPVSLHWLIRDIPSYQTIQYMGIGLKHKTPNKD